MKWLSQPRRISPLIRTFLRVLDTDGEVVTELYQGVNVSELAGGRIKIHDRQELISEVFANLREFIPASEDKIFDAAWVLKVELYIFRFLYF